MMKTFRVHAPWRRQAALAAALIAGLAAPPRPAAAHEFWLEAAPAAAVPGDTLVVRATAGTGFRGEWKPYAAPRTVRLQLRTTRTLDMTRAAVNGDLVYARFILPDAGGALVSYASHFVPIEIPTPTFEAYLRAEGLDEPLAARLALGATGPGRERYARCAKAWIAGTDAARALEPVGLDLEIVPLADPLRTSRTAYRVLFQGQPLAHALVRAWHGAPGTSAAGRDSVPPVCEGRTDGNGTVAFATAAPGPWLVSTVHMIPSRDPSADWQSLWASFTFTRPGAAAATPAPATAALATPAQATPAQAAAAPGGAGPSTTASAPPGHKARPNR